MNIDIYRIELFYKLNIYNKLVYQFEEAFI